MAEIEIGGKTAVYGIIGSPIEHTMSPAIHNHISKAMGIDSVYVPFRADGNLVNIVKGLHSLGVCGINVTVPYKTGIIKELAGIDPAARAIGAVNTLKYTDEGYHGYNTDIMGLERELVSCGISLKGRDIVILGAGGAARAAAFMCIGKGPASVTIVNRTEDKAAAIRNSLIEYAKESGTDIPDGGIRTASADDIIRGDAGGYIVFQCTNVGLSPDDDACVINDDEFFSKVETGIDLIYKPPVTMFMKRVESAGGRAFNGLKMLIYQAVCAYEIWNEVSVPERVVSDIERMLRS